MAEVVNATLIFRGGCELQNMGGALGKREVDANFTDVAHTLLSRDYKGLGNFGCNGAIEVWKITDIERLT